MTMPKKGTRRIEVDNKVWTDGSKKGFTNYRKIK